MHNLDVHNNNRGSVSGLAKWNTESKILVNQRRDSINLEKLRRVKNCKRDSIINLKSLE